MEKNTAAAPGDQGQANVVVTLEHPSFGSHVFQEQEGRLSAVIVSQIAVARKQAALRARLVALDQDQQSLQPAIIKAQERVRAAVILGDIAAIKREEAAVERLQDQVNDLAVQRQKLME